MSSDTEHWSTQAACIGKWDLFDSTKLGDKEAALALCAECPVRQLCLQDALNNEERFGIHGGVKELELRITQSINSKGQPHVYPGRRTRCAHCGRGSTKFLFVLERRRTKTHIKCSNCSTNWWTRKIINKKSTNF